MYTDEDLQKAIDAGVISSTEVAQFRAYHQERLRLLSADQENFRLLSSFNDVFVVIAILLLLSSLFGFFASLGNLWIGWLLIAVLSPLLSELFTLRRRMALPSIVLLISCLLGVCVSSYLVISSWTELSEIACLAFSALVVALTAYAHWWRYQVPLTPALLAAALVVMAVLLTRSTEFLPLSFLICGLVVFAAAVRLDARDIARVTRLSDVAFWLHLLAAPLICHSVFALLGVFDDPQLSLAKACVVMAIYLGFGLVSLIIDRRALLVSALAYVLYAMTTLLKSFGSTGASLALTGILIASSLLLLTAYWGQARAGITKYLPERVRSKVPRATRL